MIIKPSTALRNDYQTISNMVKETAEPIYITKNGEGDMVVLSIEAYERREEMLRLRERLLYSEEERLSGARTYSEEEVLQMLKGRVMGIED
jgi:prevent-host-death family protein